MEMPPSPTIRLLAERNIVEKSPQAGSGSALFAAANFDGGEPAVFVRHEVHLAGVMAPVI